MPLFDPTDYATKLGVIDPNETVYLMGLLVFIESYLLNQYSLEFGSDIETRPIQHAETPQTIFPVNFVRNITKVELKSYSDASYSKVFAANEDYITDPIKTAPKPIYQVRFLSQYVYLPYFVEITGKWSFADEVPADILAGVLSALQLGLAAYRYNSGLLSSSGKDVQRKKMGDVEVTYASGSNNQSSDYNSVIERSSLKLILDTSYKF